MNKVAWIGAGVMGAPMAGHLHNKGFDVSVYARRSEVLDKMRSQYGITKCYATIREAVADADVVFVMVGYPKDVEDVFLGEDGIFANAKSGAYLVDMTTSSPSLAVKLHEEGKKKGFHVMDAPVSGGDSGAKAGTLSIMVGAEEEDFKAVLPMFEAFGKSIVLMGGPGCGQHTKAANQICVAGSTAAFTEALVYAQKVGLDAEKMISAISGGAAGSWEQYGPPGPPRGLRPRLLCKALCEGYAHRPQRGGRARRGAGDAGFRAGPLRENDGYGSGRRRHAGSDQILSEVTRSRHERVSE